MLDRSIAREAILIKNALKGYEDSPDYHPHYCKHGAYVGDPYGPDYMCGPCEDGTDDYATALWWAKNAARERMDAFTRDVLAPAIGLAARSDEFKALAESHQTAIFRAFTELAKYV